MATKFNATTGTEIIGAKIKLGDRSTADTVAVENIDNTSGTNGAVVSRYAGSRDPNGVVTATAGSIYQRNNGTLYVNTDSITTWVALGSGGVTNLQSAYEGGGAIVTTVGDGDISFSGTQDFTTAMGGVLTLSSTGSVTISSSAAGVSLVGDVVSIDGDGYVDGDFEIAGKLTVAGLIDPTGLVLTSQLSKPYSETASDGVIWIGDTNSDGYLDLYYNDSQITVEPLFEHQLISNADLDINVTSGLIGRWRKDYSFISSAASSTKSIALPLVYGKVDPDNFPNGEVSIPILKVSVTASVADGSFFGAVKKICVFHGEYHATTPGWSFTGNTDNPTTLTDIEAIQTTILTLSFSSTNRQPYVNIGLNFGRTTRVLVEIDAVALYGED